MKTKVIIALGIFIIIFGAAAVSEERIINRKQEEVRDELTFPYLTVDLEDHEVPFAPREYIRVVKR
jgi:hypothetical protein